jgi:pimeloyl-ACP methyl ester carboxylesterase
MSLAPVITDSRLGQWFWGGVLWLFASLTRIEDPSGMVAVLMAEDAFDLGNRLHEITAPTLLIGGDRDCNYSPDLMKQTAERIPHARLIMYPGRHHNETLTDRRLFHDILAFLTDERSN